MAGPSHAGRSAAAARSGGELLSLVRAALAEDVGDGDRTTAWTVDPEARSSARIIAKARGVVAGTAFADLVFEECDASLDRRWRVGDGARMAKGDVAVEIEGRLAPILTAERTALNGLARLSGIATHAARFAAAVEGTGARVIDTRKTTPGWRSLEKAAAAAGGIRNHRMGLYDMVLIKENHIRAAGGVGAALEAVRDRAAEAGLEVEIEVTTAEELEAALRGGADRILLDNMSLEELRAAVRTASASGDPPRLEASGGVTLENVREVAGTGVDFVSVGAITHSAPALDFSLLVD